MGKGILAERTACTETLRHEMAGDGVSGVHRPHNGPGLILLHGGCGPLMVVGRFLALKGAQVGRRQGEQVGGC